jgi:high-affinity K+ transport system ATPase subunit B
MVRTRTGDFTQDVPELSNARAGAAMNELRNAAHGTPPPPLPPPPPVSLE